MTPPSAAELERRLRGRKTETEEVIRDRLRRAFEEAKYMEQYDYLLINDDLKTCVQEMNQLIQAQHLRTGSSREWILGMKEELERI